LAFYGPQDEEEEGKKEEGGLLGYPNEEAEEHLVRGGAPSTSGEGHLAISYTRHQLGTASSRLMRCVITVVIDSASC